MNYKLIIFWIARLAAAIIMLQTLYFKFTGQPESIYIFSKLGIEPWGRYGSGVVELIASILILIRSTSWIGAGLGLGVMLGAIVSHLTVLGIDVQDDGGYLFFLAIIVAISCLIILYITRHDWLAILNNWRNKTPWLIHINPLMLPINTFNQFIAMKLSLVTFFVFVVFAITPAFSQHTDVFTTDNQAIRGYDPVAYFAETNP